MSDRLLHERLRDASGDCANTVKAVGLDCKSMKKCEECYDMLRKAIADEIERQYVPVLRFPDGEPVGEGSETCYGTVSYIDVEASSGGYGNWVMHMEDGSCFEGTFSQRVEERPAPDSLEKLRQFAVDHAAYADGCSERDAFLEISDRLTALMERDA